MLAHVPVPAPQQPHALLPWLPWTQCWRFQHCNSEGLSPRDLLTLGRLLWGFNTWDQGAGCPGSRDKVPKLIPVLLDALTAPTALTSQRASSPEVGRSWETWWQLLGLKLGLGGSNGHGDQPLSQEGCAALGKVPRAGHLHSWEVWGLDGQAAVWEGVVGQGPLMTTSTTLHLAYVLMKVSLGPCWVSGIIQPVVFQGHLQL